MTNSALADIASDAAKAARDIVPRRHYRDGIELSIVGFGGIIVIGHDQKSANLEVAHAIDRGVNYFDVAPSYGEGEAERKLGIALEPYRKNNFLACKTMCRDAEGAQAEFDESLARLHTDYFDLYQLHAVTTAEEVDQILAPGGALEMIVKARDAGRVRYIGFSAHSEEASERMLDSFNFDSVLFPTNYVCFAQGNFGPRIMAKAKKCGAARLALKALAYTQLDKNEERKWKKAWYEPIDNIELARRALYFTLSEDITSAIPPGHARLFRIALDLATAFEPMSEEERNALLVEAAGLAPIFAS